MGKAAVLLTCLLTGPVFGDPASAEPQGFVAPPGLGLRFTPPKGFLLGGFRKEPVPEEFTQIGLDSPFNKAVVLIEADLAKGLDLTALPVGDVSTILLYRTHGAQAKFVRESFLKEEFRRRIQSWDVYALPSFPSPYGDQGYYYLVPQADESILEIVAHRYYSAAQLKLGEREGKPTRYDRIVEQLIASLEVAE